MSRESGKRKGKPKIFFFVEGKTEKNYFIALAQCYNLSATRTVRVMHSSGNNWIDKAKNIMAKDKRLKPDRQTKVFIIFDKDNLSSSLINKMLEQTKAIAKETAGCQIGLSNRQFEVWLLAHYESITAGMKTKEQLYSKLSNYLGKEYKKNDPDQINDILKEDKVFVAIKNTANVNEISLDKQSTNIGAIIKQIL